MREGRGEEEAEGGGQKEKATYGEGNGGKPGCQRAGGEKRR